MFFESELTKLLPLTSLDLGTFSTDFGRRIFIRLSAGRGGMAACGDLAKWGEGVSFGLLLLLCSGSVSLLFLSP